MPYHTQDPDPHDHKIAFEDWRVVPQNGQWLVPHVTCYTMTSTSFHQIDSIVLYSLTLQGCIDHDLHWQIIAKILVAKWVVSSPSTRSSLAKQINMYTSQLLIFIFGCPQLLDVHLWICGWKGDCIHKPCAAQCRLIDTHVEHTTPRNANPPGAKCIQAYKKRIKPSGERMSWAWRGVPQHPIVIIQTTTVDQLFFFTIQWFHKSRRHLINFLVDKSHLVGLWQCLSCTLRTHWLWRLWR